MANTQRPDYGQFSVILRLRQGISCSLSTYGVVMAIAEHLKPYKCICNVAFSPPNYVVHLPTLELQLQILSCKTFNGPDYVLDILPWSSEYASLNLPWLPNLRVPAPGIEVHSRQDPAVHTESASASDNIAQSSLVHESPEIGKIHIPIIEQEQHQGIIFDFSYFMISEIKDFYLAKIEAFNKCKETCKELYEIAKVFSTEISAAAEKVCNESNVYRDVDPEDPICYIGHLGGQLYHDLWFISEEMFGLELYGKPIWSENMHVIDLGAYGANLSDNQMPMPILGKVLLQAITETVVSHIYNKQVLISTTKDHTDTFCTQIWCSQFCHEYKNHAAVTSEEAEANAMYRFLKHITNTQGYTILDQNSDKLCSIICNINSLNVSISELQLQVNRISKMVSSVYENAEKLNSQMPEQICRTKIVDAMNAFEDLLTLLRHYYSTTEHGSQTFKTRKDSFRTIKFNTVFPATEDIP